MVSAKRNPRSQGGVVVQQIKADFFDLTQLRFYYFVESWGFLLEGFCPSRTFVLSPLLLYYFWINDTFCLHLILLEHCNMYIVYW
jgi:hypothetical protein